MEGRVRERREGNAQRTKYDPSGVVIALSALGESRRGRPGMACRRRSDMVVVVVNVGVVRTRDDRRHRSPSLDLPPPRWARGRKGARDIGVECAWWTDGVNCISASGSWQLPAESLRARESYFYQLPGRACLVIASLRSDRSSASSND